VDDGTSSRAASAARTGRLDALAPGQAIPFAGDRVAYVTPELAAAFRPGDRLVVVQDTGDLLHIPAPEARAAGDAVSRAAAAFARMSGISDAAITAFFEAFATRLEDDAVWAPSPDPMLRTLRAPGHAAGPPRA